MTSLSYKEGEPEGSTERDRMFEKLGYMVIFLIIFAFIMPISQMHKFNHGYKATSLEPDELSPNHTNTSEYPYRSKYILTNNEYRFYRILKPMSDARGFIICPKVGLKDLFDVTVSSKDRMTYWSKISQKHIDFLICDDKLHPVCAVELDDKSHLSEEAKKNDDFKNNLFSTSKIPLYRIPSVSHYTEAHIHSHIPVFSASQDQSGHLDV